VADLVPDTSDLESVFQDLVHPAREQERLS
jgi:hypothetical protein